MRHILLSIVIAVSSAAAAVSGVARAGDATGRMALGDAPPARVRARREARPITLGDPAARGSDADPGAWRSASLPENGRHFDKDRPTGIPGQPFDHVLDPAETVADPEFAEPFETADGAGDLSRATGHQGAGPTAGEPSGSGSMTSGALSLGRSAAVRARDRLNVKDAPFLARGDGTADDSAAIAAAIAAANAGARVSQQVCLYLPGGRYRIASTALPTFLGNGCVEGDGTNQTYIVVDRAYAGDIFSWDDAWLALNYFRGDGATADLAGQRAGPRVEGLTVVGDTTSPNIQNGLMFYDRADFAYLRNVDVLFLHGRCFAAGIKRGVRTAAMRESTLDATRFWACGTPALPAVEIGSDGLDADDATNEIDWRGLSIDAPNGPGLVLRNRGGNLMRDIRFRGLRVEGPTGAVSRGDLIRIGDPAYPGRIADVSIEDLQTNGSQPGFAALAIASATAASQPYAITVKGAIGNGAGLGLDIRAGRGLRFDLRGIATTGTNVRVGATPLVGSDILLDAWGQERYFSYSIDPSALPFFHTPGPFKVGDPSKPSAQSLVSKVHDSSASGGFAPGRGAVDLQVDSTGTDGSRVAQGPDTVLVGGVDNRAGAGYGVQVGGQSNLDDSFFGVGVGGQGNRQSNFADVIVGGAFNALSGSFSSILGGSQATDRHRYGWQGYASGSFARQGDAQTGINVLRAAGTAAMRLTADGLAAGGVAASTNCINIPDETAYGLKIQLEARDVTSGAAAYAWSVPVGTLLRGTGAGSTALTLGTATAVGSGAVTAAPDTALGCLSLTFTPPNGHIWHAVARVETVEVQ